MNCSTRYVKGSGASFFRFPTNKHQRQAWIKAISRAKWSPSVHDRLCQNHFAGKTPSADPAHVDYFPTIFADRKGIRFTPVKRGGERLERLEKRKQRRLSAAEAVSTISCVETTTVDSTDDSARIVTDVTISGSGDLVCIGDGEEQIVPQQCLQDVGKSMYSL